MPVPRTSWPPSTPKSTTSKLILLTGKLRHNGFQRQMHAENWHDRSKDDTSFWAQRLSDYYFIYVRWGNAFSRFYL